MTMASILIAASFSLPCSSNHLFWNNSPSQLAMSEYDDDNSNTYTIVTSTIQGGLSSIQTGNNDNIFWLVGNMSTDPLFSDV